MFLQNNIIGTFLKLEQLLTTNDAFNKDDFIIAAIPSADQVSLLINASALNETSAAAVSSSSGLNKQKKVSVSSIESDKIVEEPRREEEIPEAPTSSTNTVDLVVKEEEDGVRGVETL